MEIKEREMGEVIVIASGKDGMGKTVLAVNLGIVLAQREHSIVLMDLNIGSRNLDICLGMENRVIYDLADVITGVCRIRQAMVKDRRYPRLYLVSAPQNSEKAQFSDKHLMALCEKLKQAFDFIIIDAPAGAGPGLKLASAPADRAVIVTVPEYAALRDTETVDRILENSGIGKRSMVINKIMAELHGTGLVPDPEEMAETLRLPVSGLIPYDRNIHISSNIGIPIASVKESYIARNMAKIAERIIIRS